MASSFERIAPIPTSDDNKIGDTSLSLPVAPSIGLLKNKTKRKLKLHEFEEEKQKQNKDKDSPEFFTRSDLKQLIDEHLKKEHDRLSLSPWKIVDTLFNTYDVSVRFSNILLLNNNEFIVSPRLNRRTQSTHKDIGIYKYNFIDNKWSLYIAYPKIYKVNMENHHIAIDYDKQIIYINIGCQHICKCHIQTKKYEWIEIKTKFISKPKELSWNLSAVINGEYHIFLGSDNNTHLKYNDKQQKYDIMHEFKELDIDKGLISYGMVYNSLDKYYLLFGGYKGKGLGRSDAIYKYYVSKQKWDKLDIVMPDKMQSFGSVITPNCKYVLILGGSNSKGFSNKIYYLNLLTMKWNESKILCPLKHVSNNHVIITPVNNKYINLVNGYIRNIKLEIPLKINKSIKTYLNYIEYLHVLQGSYLHVIADIDYIISKQNLFNPLSIMPQKDEFAVNVEEPDLGDFLVGKGLSKYKDAVIDAGLDDIKDIKDLDDETVEVIIKEAGFKKIHGNIFRKAVKAYKDGKYNPKVADPLAKLTKLVREKRKHLKGYVARQIDNINAKDSKTIIFIGQTGVGKTTVINSICNYLEQVSYEEPFRYKLICEENNKKVDTNDPTKSQTQDITTYHLENVPAIKEAVNIVDTPGFGDTEGPQKDIKIRNQFKRFFEERCPFIDGIYFIIKASDTRVGAIQRYIFNMVLDLFGDDVKENIFVLFTFSDGQTPPALKAVNKLGIEYAQEFRINNSGFGLADDEENKNNVFHQTFFDVGNQQFGTIFEALSAVRTKSTEKTKETLRERQNITASLEEISINLVSKLDEIKREKKQCEIIATAQVDIDSNADFQISFERAIIYRDYGSKAMLCNSCREYPEDQTLIEGKTCHSNCVSGSVFWCKQMSWFSGCKICGCAKAKHEQVNYRVRKRYEKIYINKKEMANKYDLAKGEKVTAENLMRAVKRKIKKCEEDTAATIQRMKKSVDRLQQIALNKTVMSNEKYFDSLIAAETQTKEEGWVERVNELIKMKNNFKRLDAVVKGDVDAKTLQEQWMNDEKENEKVNVNVQVSGSNVNVQVNVSQQNN